MTQLLDFRFYCLDKVVVVGPTDELMYNKNRELKTLLNESL